MSNKFERCLVEGCAPTLAGIKAGSLFRYEEAPGEDIRALVSLWNMQFEHKGLSLRLLHARPGAGLVYVYRPEKLAALLADGAVTRFLTGRGFQGCPDAEQCLLELQRRVSGNASFPHEIGIFLGYPLEDVEGFIEHKGENCRLCGPWKVYGREGVAERLFARYKHCLAVYRTLFEKGADVLKLTVAA